MAYNPFNIFRRNQKAIFAVVTVFIMFTFVLSSGLGGGADFFDWLPQWLGKKTGKKGEEVCKIDGTKVYDGELRQLSFNREMANRFMAAAADQAERYLRYYEDEQLRQVNNPRLQLVLSQGPTAQRLISDPRLASLRFSDPQRYAEMRQIAEEYASIATSPTAPPAAKQVVLARHHAQMLQQQLAIGRDRQYFINAPNRTQRDLVNFLLWQKKADQLGIKFTEDDIKRLIQHEFFNAFKSDVEIRKSLQQGLQGFTMDKCLAAIGEEFRVRTAQVAVLGPGMHGGRTDKTFGGTPMFNPAYEVFDFYRDQASPTLYEVVAVPGANYLDKVVGEPTEAELKKLYDDYQNLEYDPGLERPGFKIPRTVKLGWVSATGTEPYYLKKAEETLRNEELQSALWSLAAVGTGVAPADVATAARPFVANPLADLYASRIEADHNRKLAKDAYDAERLLLLMGSSVVRAPNMAAALGGLAGGQLTLGGPFPGLALFDTATGAMERRDRIKAGAAPLLLMLGTVPGVPAGHLFGIPVGGKPVPAPAFGPGLFPNIIGGLAAYQMLLPKPLPFDAVRGELLKELRTSTAQRLAFAEGKRVRPDRTYPNNVEDVPGDMPTYTEVVSKLSNAGGFIAALALPKFMHDFATERGWQRGESVAAHDEWTLEDDPGLAPLKAAFPKTVHGNLPVRFGDRFFWTRNRQDGKKMAATGTFTPEYYPNAPTGNASPEAKPEPTFLVWRSEETASKSPSSMGQVRDAVKAAWKRIKGRELAKARAEAIAKAIQSKGGDFGGLASKDIKDEADNLKAEFNDPKAKDRVKLFTITDVAPLTTAEPDFTNPFGGLRPFRVLPTNDIPYPSADMTRQLLDERTKPPRTTFVMVDEPKDTYYVATVIYRSQKSPSEFERQVYRESGMNRGVVMSEFLRDSQRKTYESVMGLLKKEFKYEESEDQKKRLDENEKRGGDQS